MHRFTIADAQILLGLYYADKGDEISCQKLIASCADVIHSLPTLPEFAEAFNKFLYISAIGLNGDKVTLGNFGRDIIDKARNKTSGNVDSDELALLVLKELAGYKLKSMCNRTVWTQEQYQQAIDIQINTLKE